MGTYLQYQEGINELKRLYPFSQQRSEYLYLSAVRSQQPSWRHLPTWTNRCLPPFHARHLKHLSNPGLDSLVHFPIPTHSQPTQDGFPDLTTQNVSLGMKEDKEEKGDEEDN